MTASASSLDIRRFIDERPVGRYQLLVALLCGLIVFVDGFDAQAMGFVAPALSADLQIARRVLGTVISAGLVGMCKKADPEMHSFHGLRTAIEI